MRKYPLLTILALVFILGCGTARDIVQKDDRESFQYSTDRYYKLIQWKYYEKAAQFVDPESARAYENFVFRNQKDLNVTAYQIQDVTYIGPGALIGDESRDESYDGDSERAVLRVYFTYFKYPSVVEESVMIEDTWIKIGKLWYVTSDYPEGTFK